MTGYLTRRLIERLPNFIAMKEASLNSETFLEIARGRRILFLGRGGLSQLLHPAL